MAETEPKQSASVQPIAGADEQSAASDLALPAARSFDGLSGPNPEPQDFLGFPIFDAKPTHDDLEGKLVAVNDGSFRGLAVFLGAAWRLLSAYLGAYGEIYLGSGTKTLTCTNAGQEYLIGDGNGVGSNGISGGGVSVDQGGWAITPVAGNYRVTLTVCFSVDRTCKLDIFALQGSDLVNVHAEFTVTATGTIYTVSVSGLCTLTTSSVRPKVVSDTAGAVITWERINLHIASV